MPRTLTQFRVFIGSPGGLEDERRAFHRALTLFNEAHGEPDGIIFTPVGWEDTLGGVGRPQGLINEDLSTCDFAVFVLHERWGTPTGSGNTSGTEEEWQFAQKLYDENTIRNICLFFKSVDPSKKNDAGPQLAKVLQFRSEIEQDRKHLFHNFEGCDEFQRAISRHLAKWMRDHKAGGADMAPGVASTEEPVDVAGPSLTPGFAYWIAEARRLGDREGGEADLPGALFCAGRALHHAVGSSQTAAAESTRGTARFRLGDIKGAIESYSVVERELQDSEDPVEIKRLALVLFNKGVALNAFGRPIEAVEAYSTLIGRFGGAAHAALHVAKARVNLGVIFGTLDRFDEEMSQYSSVLAECDSHQQVEFQIQIAKAMFNKSVALEGVGRSTEAVEIYNQIIDRFKTSEAVEISRCVSISMFNKANDLSDSGFKQKAEDGYRTHIEEFRHFSDKDIIESVARSMINFAILLSADGKHLKEMEIYDDLIRSFPLSDNDHISQEIAMASAYRAVALSSINRRDEAIEAFGEVIDKFSEHADERIVRTVATSELNRAGLIEDSGNREEARRLYRAMISKYKAVQDPDVKDTVSRARGALHPPRKAPRTPLG